MDIKWLQLHLALTWSKCSNLRNAILVSLPIAFGSCVNLGLPDRSNDSKVVISQMHEGTSYKLFLARWRIESFALAMLLGRVSNKLSLNISELRDGLHLQFLGSSTILFSESLRSRSLGIWSKRAGMDFSWFLLKSREHSLSKVCMLPGTLVSKFEAKKSFSTHLTFSSHAGSISPSASFSQSICFLSLLQPVLMRIIPTASFLLCCRANPIGTAIRNVSLSEIYNLWVKQKLRLDLMAQCANKSHALLMNFAYIP